MNSQRFIGSVNHKILKENLSEDEFLDIKTRIIDFEDYWLNGFNPNIGKDVPSSKPNFFLGNRHVHLKPLIGGFKNIEEKNLWKKWKNKKIKYPFLNSEHNLSSFPTSNYGFLYFVDKDRIAYLYHYCDNDMHEFINSREYLEIAENLDEYFEKNKKYPISNEQHIMIFTQKWLSNV